MRREVGSTPSDDGLASCRQFLLSFIPFPSLPLCCLLLKQGLDEGTLLVTENGGFFGCSFYFIMGYFKVGACF